MRFLFDKDRGKVLKDMNCKIFQVQPEQIYFGESVSLGQKIFSP